MMLCVLASRGTTIPVRRPSGTRLEPESARFVPPTVASNLILAAGLASGAPALALEVEPIDESAANRQPAIRLDCSVKAISDHSPNSRDAPCMYWAAGARIKVGDLREIGTTYKWRPILGLRYKRWRFGTADVSDWLGFSGFRKEPTVSYSAFERANASARLSTRVHNITTGEGASAFESGKYTVRGRFLLSLDIDRYWSLGGEISHDLLNRGDGQTVSAGFGRRFPISERAVMTTSAGLTWGTAEHWRTLYASSGAIAAGLGPGIGSAGVGVSLRIRINDHWAWYATASAGRALGGPARLGDTRVGYSGDMGIIRFGAF